MNKMQSLEADATERYSRSYNARFLGVPEETGEQCASVVNDLLCNKLGQSGQAIGLYREIAIAIQKESGDSNGGNV